MHRGSHDDGSVGRGDCLCFHGVSRVLRVSGRVKLRAEKKVADLQLAMHINERARVGRDSTGVTFLPFLGRCRDNNASGRL